MPNSFSTLYVRNVECNIFTGLFVGSSLQGLGARASNHQHLNLLITGALLSRSRLAWAMGCLVLTRFSRQELNPPQGGLCCPFPPSKELCGRIGVNICLYVLHTYAGMYVLQTSAESVELAWHLSPLAGPTLEGLQLLLLLPSSAASRCIRRLSVWRQRSP